MKWFWILVLVAIGLLYLTNPDMNDFEAFIAEESIRLVREQAGAPGLGDILSNQAGQLAENYVESITNYEDYYLFSTYRINLAPATVSKRSWRFVGVGGTFINLSRFYDKD